MYPMVVANDSPTSESPADSEAATAAETFAMHRMTQRNKTSFLVTTTAVLACLWMALPAEAQMVRHADVDFEGSGFVTPAGMVPPSMYDSGVMQAAYQPMPGGIMPVGHHAGYGGGYCDTVGGCDGGCDCGRGGVGGLLGSCLGSSLCGADGMCPLRHICLFCQGSGCSACQGLSNCLALADCLLPYREAGICAQRWYDVSAEAVFLLHSSGDQSGVVTTDGVNGIPVLNLSDVNIGDDVEAGIRLSGSLIFGVASNLELTYMGGQQWDDRAVGLPNPVGSPTLFSFISDFGTNPQNTGFDDTDRSLEQSLESTSSFHSVEWNYRRRTMGPYCRFQGSWLVGLRYNRFDNRLVYATLGENDNTVNQNLPRFFSSNDRVKNNLFGPQAGFDVWWNVCPGINLGMGVKGAWVQNDAKRQTILTGNSLNPLATPGSVMIEETERNGTLIGEFEASFIYRFSHSWSFRSSYYAIAMDDIAFGTVDGELARDFITVSPLQNPAFYRDTLVLQGLSFGTEYMW